MKKLLLFSLFLLTTICSIVAWKPLSPEDTERRAINQQIMRISEFYAARGGIGSSSYKGAIQGLLQSIGTPLAQKMYQEQFSR